MIFPEGLISPPGEFHAPRSGVARLALKTGVPVVPLGISLHEENCKRVPTTLEGKPDILTWYLRGPYAVTVGKPLVKTIAETIMQHICDLAQESRQRVQVKT
ncbi:MAG: hypothetical protein Fur0016_09410 [Anaerolineales bacterium]